MPSISEYQRPTELPVALELLQRTSPRTVALAGGTWLVPRLGNQVPADAVVDLGGLGLAGIERDPDTLRLGAMTTLAAVAQDPLCRDLADGILVETARRDASLNVRNAATVGGTLVVCPVDSEFPLALLALGADLTVHADRPTLVSLQAFLQDPAGILEKVRGLITQIHIPLAMHTAGAVARVSRTPGDHSIVAAVAVITEDADAIRVALGGVASRPLLICVGQEQDAAEAVAAAIAAGELHADFRGSAGYRREMGVLMAQRALEQALALYRQ